jgi:hypothetical protein
MKKDIIRLLCFISAIIPIRVFSQVPVDSISISNFADTLYFDSSASNSIDVISKSGSIILESGEKENLARGRRARMTYFGKGTPYDTARANGNRVLDGNMSTFIEIRPGGDGSYIMIDLQALRRINKVVMKTFGLHSPLRPRAYTIYVGTDSIQLGRVAQRENNLDTITVDIFDPVLARYVKITFDVIDKISSTVISEIEVYGLGYLPSGTYVSKVIDVGQPVNWGYAKWDVDLPDETFVIFQFRTGGGRNVDESWSNWSPPIEIASGRNLKNYSSFRVYEPRRFIQFKITLITNSTETPVVKKLTIVYQKKLVARMALVQVEPRTVPILRRVELSYIIDLKFDENSLGIDTLVIQTPSPCFVSSVSLDGNPINYVYSPDPYEIKIAFSQTIRMDAKLVVKFNATLYLDKNEFPGAVISASAGWNPQFVDVGRENGVERWTVFTSNVPERLISFLEVEPNPFSPNGDGLNDNVKISFYLSNLIEARPLKIHIYDLTGKLIRTIHDAPSIASAYVGTNAFLWDGRDNSGRPVRPGVYLLRVAIESDNGGEVEYRTITVVY